MLDVLFLLHIRKGLISTVTLSVVVPQAIGRKILLRRLTMGLTDNDYTLITERITEVVEETQKKVEAKNIEFFKLLTYYKCYAR